MRFCPWKKILRSTNFHFNQSQNSHRGENSENFKAICIVNNAHRQQSYAHENLQSHVVYTNLLINRSYELSPTAQLECSQSTEAQISGTNLLLWDAQALDEWNLLWWWEKLVKIAAGFSILFTHINHHQWHHVLTVYLFFFVFFACRDFLEWQMSLKIFLRM